MKKNNFLFFFFFFILLLSCGNNAKDKNNKPDPAIKVESFTVKEEELVPEIQTFGTISFKAKADIYPKTTGRIENIYVEQGARVIKGQVIAVLEQFQLQLELSQAVAELESSQSSLELSKAKYEDRLKSVERQFLTIEKAKAELEDKKNSLDNIKNTLDNKEKLLKEGAVTDESVRNLRTQYYSAYTQYLIAERDLKIQEIGYRDKDITEKGFKVPGNQEDKIKILKEINTQILAKEVEVAASGLKIAQSKVKSVEAYLNETYIRSPITGIIAARYLELGEQAKQDSKIFTVMDTYNVYAKINISESDLVRIKPNGKVLLSVDSLGKKNYEGAIELISPIIDAKTRTVEISVIIKNHDGSLIPGMFIRAKVKSDEKRKTIFIPPSSLVSVEKDQADVFVIKKNIAFRKTVKIGPEQNDMIEIINGLNDADILIDNPPMEVIEGSKVEVINSKEISRK